MKRLTFDSDQIKLINRIFHDFEADIYSEYHPEIDTEEVKWERISDRYLNQDRKITLLDVGTGNGFVPYVTGKHLKAGDILICSDISDKMLAKANKRLSVYTHIEKRFIAADALLISKMEIEADIITMNSVLHHLPDYEEVLEHLAKRVKTGGLFIIMHERNQRFCRNVPLLMRQCLFLAEMNRLARKVVGTVLVSLKLYKRKFARDELYAKVAAAIKEQGISNNLLSTEEINALVDFHDPDEGGEGFDPFLLKERFFKNFEIVELFTDMHLGPWMSSKKDPFRRILLKFLENRFPYTGAIFGLIMRKIADPVS